MISHGTLAFREWCVTTCNSQICLHHSRNAFVMICRVSLDINRVSKQVADFYEACLRMIEKLPPKLYPGRGFLSSLCASHGQETTDLSSPPKLDSVNSAHFSTESVWAVVLEFFGRTLQKPDGCA